MHNKTLSNEYRVLSSAKLHISDFPINKNISFMNILNSSGPNIHPWGIPRKNVRPVTIGGSYFSFLFSAIQVIEKKS